MNETHILTLEEAQIACDLAMIWKRVKNLPLRADDMHEFQHAINAAMRIIISQPGHRQLEDAARIKAATSGEKSDGFTAEPI